MILPRHLGILLLVVGSASVLTGKPKPVPVAGHMTAPPPVIATQAAELMLQASLAPEDRYSIGEPSDEEQAIVEQINRARADAAQEALRLANTPDTDVQEAICFFGVNLPEMINQFATLPQVLPPLSINPHLTEMARLHSQDMLANVFQGHTSSSNPPAPFAPSDSLALRAANFPYSYSSLGENVFAYSISDYYGHASFEIDWGYDAFGMQSPPEHRETIHNAQFQEIGLGVIKGSNSVDDLTVGPLLITQVFGAPQSAVPFITGVAYYDLNGNGAYDAGEGLGGLTLETAEEAAWALTANSGGYSVPVSADGTYTVTVSGLGITPQITSVTVAGGKNVKQDLVINYIAPSIFGSSTPVTGADNAYSINPVPGATSYWAKVYTENVATWVEGAENGGTGLVFDTSPNYPVIQGEVVRNGLNAFHMAHEIGGQEQVITLNQVILPTASSEIRFGSRLRYATVSQKANVDISIDEGNNWINVYKQAGSGGSGEAGFVYRFINLGAFAGKPLKIRFRYSVEGCSPSIFPTTTTDYGWIIDDITVANATRLNVESETVLGSPTYLFNPVADGEYLLTARPLNNFKGFPFGPLLRVTAGPTGPYGLWLLENFDPADLNDPAREATIWGDLADPDKDGFGNFLEYALNGNPNSADAAALTPNLIQSGGTLTLQYTMHRSELTYRVLGNTVLEGIPWTTTGVTQDPDPDVSPEGTPIDASTAIGTDRRFLMLEVTGP